MEKLTNCNDLIQEYMESLHLIPTGITEIDKLLNGGFYSSQLFEIIGAAGSGKTELCLNLLKNGFKTTQDRFLYLDSGQSFSYSRFLKLVNLEENPKNLSIIQQKIIHKKYFSKKALFLELISLISELEKLSNPLQNSLRYIIIDNFSSAWVPISDFMEYDLWLSEISKIFKLLNNKFYIGVLVTSFAKTEKKEFFGSRKKRILPAPWQFYPNISLFLEKSKIMNPEKNQMTITTKYSLLQNEYNDPLRTVKIIETNIIK